MLYTATALTPIPAGTDFWITGYGVRIGPKPEIDEDDPEDGCVHLCKSQIDIPADAEFFVHGNLSEYTVSLTPPEGWVSCKITEKDIINDNLCIPFNVLAEGNYNFSS